MENKTIITISRQFGSGGREIGKKIADQLGIPFYDKELIEIAAKESGMDKELFEEDDARTSKGFRLLGALGYSLGGPLSTITELSLNDRLYLVQEEVIKGVACEGSCVIVGRCADYALSDNPDCINIFIHADLDVRIKNVSRNLNITENKARDIINKTDKQRASYYNYYTSKKWGDSKSYNLSLDAGKLGTDNCVEMILKFRELMDAMK